MTEYRGEGANLESLVDGGSARAARIRGGRQTPQTKKKGARSLGKRESKFFVPYKAGGINHVSH